MLYFIPAWYHENEWKEMEQFWYRRRMHSETDDTVKQIQLFQRNQICRYEILLLSYAPNLRHFLHRQGVFHAPYWSCFDAIQEIHKKKPAIFSFHNLNWPSNIEFIYSSFAVIAMLDHKKYAQIEFGEDGNMIQVDLYCDNMVSRRNIYDDRGFISCTILYENGKMEYEQYLTEKGVWKICHFMDGHVVVNPQSNHFLIRTDKGEVEIPFSQQTYASMENIIYEVASAYFQFTKNADIFCTALHPRHMRLMRKMLNGRKTIFSTFNNRISLKDNDFVKDVLEEADCIITDSEKNYDILADKIEINHNKLVNIPPYETRRDFGTSQQVHVQKILLAVDQLAQDEFKKVIVYLASYLERNKNARVHLLTRKAEYNREDILLDMVKETLESAGFPQEWARKVNSNKFELLLDYNERIPILFKVEQCVDDLSVNKCLREQRILLDLAIVPDLFLQISSVSMGIPQITKTRTQYMHPGKNGRINQDLSMLEDDIAFYLENLKNWNEAMIFSYELGKKYSRENLIKQWKEVIDKIDKGTTAWNKRL